MKANSFPSAVAENENAKWVLFDLDATELEQAGRNNMRGMGIFTREKRNLFERRRTGRGVGGAKGAAAPPKFRATQIFRVARENLGKASF